MNAACTRCGEDLYERQRKDLWPAALSAVMPTEQLFEDDIPGSLMRFSGAFTVGDMAGDNECLKARDFDDSPELVGKNFEFYFTELELL